MAQTKINANQTTITATDIGAFASVASLPLATSANLGQIVQYTGATTANYTHGYIYECTAKPAAAASAVQVEDYMLKGGTVTTNIFDADTFGELYCLQDGVPVASLVKLIYSPEGYSDEIAYVNLNTGETGSAEFMPGDHGYWDCMEIDWGTGTLSSDDYVIIQYTPAVQEATYIWKQSAVQPITQTDSLPFGAEATKDKIYQYTGITNDSYENGYFYKYAEYLNLLGETGDASSSYKMIFAIDLDSFYTYLRTKNITVTNETSFYVSLETDSETGDAYPALYKGTVDPSNLIEAFTNLQVNWDAGGYVGNTGIFFRPYLEDTSESNFNGVSENDLGFVVNSNVIWKRIDTQPTIKVVEIPTGDFTEYLHGNTIYNCKTLAELSGITPYYNIPTDYTSQINFTSGTTPTTNNMDYLIWSGDDVVDGTFTPIANKRYCVMFYYDGINDIRGIVQGTSI